MLFDHFLDCFVDLNWLIKGAFVGHNEVNLIAKMLFLAVFDCLRERLRGGGGKEDLGEGTCMEIVRL